MKITWVLDNINIINGMVRVAIGLSNYFARNGSTVKIISFYSENTNPFFSLSEDVYVENLGLDWSKLSRHDKHRILGAVMEASDADILITSNEWANTSSVINKSKFHGKLIITQHMSCRNLSRKRRVLNCLMHRFADKFVVLTEDDCSYYRKFGVKNCIVIPNAIHTQTIDISNKENIVCSIGRIEHVKGFDLLIQAFSLVAKDAPNWKLRIFGDGSQRKNLMDKIIELKLSDQIQMPGMCNTIEKELARSSIYVLSSRYEGFGLTLLEAMNEKNAIVAFKLPVVEEILTSESAILVSPENVDELAAALRKMIFDVQLREQMSLAGFEISKKYTVECIGEQWYTLFDDLLNKNHG